MKTYKGMFDEMIKPETVAKCALDAADGKLKRKEVIRAFTDFEKTYRTVVACAKDPAYKPCEDNTHEIIDGANNKPREIEKPKFCPEQILHHMIVEPFKQVLLNGLYEEAYGCLPPLTKRMPDGKIKTVKKFGPHAAIKRLVKWVQTGKKCYVGEADVHHAYASVNIDILLRQLERRIKDEEWMRITKQFLYHGKEQGLILGHYTSPWLFNYYMKDFDHFAAALDGVKYLRYADNIYIVGKNKRKVHRAMMAMSEYLQSELAMTLNKSWQVYRFEYGTGKFDENGKEITRGRAVNALGAVIHHNRVTLRKSILLRMRRKSLRIGRKEKVTWHDGSSMFSRLSWVRKTSTYQYYEKYIKPNINTRQLKRKVRNHSKAFLPIAERRRTIVYDGLEKGLQRIRTGRTG